MLVALGVLLAPVALTLVVMLIVQRWWTLLLLAVALIPPVWLGSAFASDTSDDSNLYGPFILAALELVGLWVLWYQHDPKSAGQALAVTEGAAAAYHVKQGRPVLGAITAAGAVSQWEHSTSLPSGQPVPRSQQPGISTPGSTMKHGPGESSRSGPTVGRRAGWHGRHVAPRRRHGKADDGPVTEQVASQVPTRPLFPPERSETPAMPKLPPGSKTPFLASPTKHWKGPGWNWSYDWCFARRLSHCWYPKSRDEEGTKAEGYAVFVPFDRGVCPFQKWAEQEHECPYSQPGQHVPGGRLDVTVPWSEGGQRGGIAEGAGESR